MSSKFILIHAHGNNFGLILNNIPDVIEITYLYIHSPKTMRWYFLNFRKYIQSFIFISVIIIINYNPYISIGLLEHGLFGH